MSLRGILAVVRFEGRRSLRPARVVWWALLAALPLLLALLIRAQEPRALDRAEELATYLYILVVRALCPLALLLWATPAVHAEMEAKAWPYIAVSPRGRVSLLVGKYLVAVLWAIVVGAVSVASCALVVSPGASPRVWETLLALVVLSSTAYGAVYVLLGVLFLKRGMVVTVAYTCIVEVALTMVPAVVNQLTIDYRLRTILVRELGLVASLGRGARDFVAAGSALEQAAILCGYALGALITAALVLKRKQLVVAEE